MNVNNDITRHGSYDKYHEELNKNKSHREFFFFFHTFFAVYAFDAPLRHYRYHAIFATPELRCCCFDMLDAAAAADAALRCCRIDYALLITHYFAADVLLAAAAMAAAITYDRIINTTVIASWLLSLPALSAYMLSIVELMLMLRHAC